MITAVGMVDELAIMAIAVIVAVAVMLIFAVPVGNFVERRPSIKILALSPMIAVK